MKPAVAVALGLVAALVATDPAMSRGSVRTKAPQVAITLDDLPAPVVGICQGAVAATAVAP